MAQKRCEKCSEMVDEAKAFCPGCGHAFVEEQKRQNASEFDKLDSTVQLGQTMYNQMLSDMGLKTSKAPDPQEKRVEVIKPATQVTLQPAVKVTETKPAPAKANSNLKWYLLGAAVLLIGFLLLVAIVALLYIYRARLF
ncbi:hypothetical protein BH10ACI3_BH10ACI3_02540 [soil metagenome]